jgi:hypothetical protein
VNDPVKSFDESTLKTFPATFESLERQGILTPTVTLDRLKAGLSADQRAIVEEVINLKPRDFGVDTPYAGELEPVPADLVKVTGQLINGYGGDIAKTIRHASPPNYSQHTIASKAAIDFKNVDGSPSPDNPEDFKDTVEYAWLRRHGSEFSFYESWPEGNEFGMRAEPWHWQYRP